MFKPFFSRFVFNLPVVFPHIQACISKTIQATKNNYFFLKSAQKTAYVQLCYICFTHKTCVCSSFRWGRGVAKRMPVMFRKTTRLTKISTLDQLCHNSIPNCLIYTKKSGLDRKNSLLSIESGFKAITSLLVGQSRGTQGKVGFTVQKCYLHEAYLNNLLRYCIVL